MRKITKCLISMMLVISLLFMATVPAFAAWWDEEYISDLRLVYANEYKKAKGILLEAGLRDYKVLSTNLNENTDKIGVFLAYKTTTNIEEAITDIAVMQMNGGYNEGNYQEMIRQSYIDYLEFGENYLAAIDYFNEAYDAGHYLSEIAHRQLNFYNVVTEGSPKIPDFEGERLGDIFYGGIDASDLATMFMEGNAYALDNIRSLIAMGVSYNADGKTYLEKVADEAEKYSANNDVYANEDFGRLAAIIAPTITVFRDMFKELEAHEGELNYEDEEITEKELYYAEYKVMSEMAKATNYLDGKTFYRFCLDYKIDLGDCSQLYPLVAALNDGQKAMTEVAHFYDVVRYSMTLEKNEDIEAKLSEMEEKYSQNPFNVYTGVDRTIYNDSFALTGDAYRADASTESGLAEALYGGKLPGFNIAATVVGSLGAAYLAYGLGKFGYSVWTASRAISAYDVQYDSIVNNFLSNANVDNISNVFSYYYADTPTEIVNSMFKDCIKSQFSSYSPEEYAGWTISQKYAHLETYCNLNTIHDGRLVDAFSKVNTQFGKYAAKDPVFMSAQGKASVATQNVKDSLGFLKGAAIVGGLMMLVSAVKLGYSMWHYYHPEYSDIPTAMVDLIDTPDGDRYIKYDVVYEAEPRSDGTLIAADLNAFSGERWNALYYTKNYEAGKPLLAGEFEVSNKNNVPRENYMPVHRFGEVVSYNLNKYNFDDDYTIYLSVKQSKKQKAAIADVPEIVGSVVSTGHMILAGGVGAILGVGGTFGTVEIIRRRKNKAISKAEATDEV